jgi:rhodanese-related sulfurtransferase
METISTKAIEICPTSTFKRVQEGALLVDVREKAELLTLSFNVPNIINIPISEFDDKYAKIPKDLDVIVVCDSGIRSLKATYFLLYHGYTNVVNMHSGIEKWVKKGFPIVGDASSFQSDSCCSSSCGC